MLSFGCVSAEGDMVSELLNDGDCTPRGVIDNESDIKDSERLSLTVDEGNRDERDSIFELDLEGVGGVVVCEWVPISVEVCFGVVVCLWVGVVVYLSVEV